MRLDPLTIVAVAGTVFMFSGVLMILARGPRRDRGPMIAWGSAMLIGAAGMAVLGAAREWVSLANGVANALFLGATGVSWTATRLFVGQRPRPLLVLAGPVLWMASVPWQDGSGIWLSVVCLIGVAYTIANGMELWSGRAEPLPSRNLALAMIAIHSAFFLGRAAQAALTDMPGPREETISIVLLIESLLHTNGMAFLLLAMTKERVQRRATAQLRELSLRDGLTGIGNRRSFDARLAAEVRRAARNGTSVSLLLADVDLFKAYNDRFGHPAGDDCLRAIAGALVAAARRPGDQAFRYGGEEFAVLLPDSDEAAALAVADRMQAMVRALNIPHATGYGIVTISLGVATRRAGPGTAAELLTSADSALYSAKAAGRDRVMIAVT